MTTKAVFGLLSNSPPLVKDCSLELGGHCKRPLSSGALETTGRRVEGDGEDDGTEGDPAVDLKVLKVGDDGDPSAKRNILFLVFESKASETAA